MYLDNVFALVVFAMVSSGTPGPNNIMLMTSGVNFGFQKTLPHMLGVSIGFMCMLILVGVGIIKLFDLYTVSYDILKVLSVCYMLYLAFKIASASDALSPSNVASQNSTSSPISFVQASLFQWVNPKAWSMAITATSVFAPNKDFLTICLVTLVFGLVNFPTIICWTLFGMKMRVWLNNARRLRVFNYCMASLLVLSLVPSLI